MFHITNEGTIILHTQIEMMNSKLSFTLIAWLITALLVLLIMLPIYSQIGLDFPFYFENIIFIIIFATFTRWIFMMKFHWFSHNTKVKAVLVFAVIPLILLVVDSLWDFQRFMDEDGIYSIMDALPASRQSGLAQYIKTEMTLFWAGAFISSILLPLRMIASIWTQRHRGRV